MDPIEVMTPQSFSEISFDPSSPSSTMVKLEDDEVASPSATVDGDSKPTKKRKSWGQVLPEPKTNLPPRKRAKTDDEKEQRRVERVLRNRRAAQSSRERKRLEVEALEIRNQSLEALLQNAEKANKLLMDELTNICQSHGIASFSQNITLSQQLFNSTSIEAVVSPATLNPASLSPLPEVDEEPSSLDATTSNDLEPSAAEASLVVDSSLDLAQHPAAMLSDLQCQSMEVSTSQSPSTPTISPTMMSSSWLLLFQMMLLSASTTLSLCQRPLMQIASSLKAGFSLRPNPHILTTIIWMVTLPPELRSKLSTSTTSSLKKRTMSQAASWLQPTTTPSQRTTISTHGSSTLRLKFLKKLLSSSPMLARPLMDATMVALRLVVSEERDDQAGAPFVGTCESRERDVELTKCLKRITLPSKEVLLTLLWALKVEQQRKQRKNVAITVYPASLTRSNSVINVSKEQRKQPAFHNMSNITSFIKEKTLRKQNRHGQSRR